MRYQNLMYDQFVLYFIFPYFAYMCDMGAKLVT